MKIKIDKRIALNVMQGIFTVGSLVVGAILKKDEIAEAAKQAAEILKKENH